MSKNKKRHIKKIAMVATPIVLLCAISYATVLSRSQAHQSAFAYERYYDEYSDTEDEYNDKNDFPGDSDGMEDSIEVITGHESVELDTDPQSITVLVNKELSLPKDYIPDDLVVPDVLFSISYFDEKKQLRSEAAKSLEQLFQAAEDKSLVLYGVSGYRSYQRQYDIFTSNIVKQGIDHTAKYSAKPGYSEHQTGLSIDVSAKSVNNRLDASFADTLEGKWLAQNAHLYGFIIRYPEDKTEITGYSYEPWHIRYVGKALATYLYEDNLCLEEYYNFEPSVDYSDEISYDNLVDYGIDLEDVITKPEVTTPTQPPKKETIEETVDDTSEDTVEDTKDDEVTATPVPTKKPKPTATPKPTVKPTEKPTPTLAPTPTEIPVPSEAPTDPTTEPTVGAPIAAE